MRYWPYIALLICLCFPRLYAHAQKENNTWAFGINAGIDFNSGTPIFFPSVSQSSEGCATVCDKDGNLLFYSDGRSVLNRKHKTMPNGKYIPGMETILRSNYNSSTQGVAIVPFVDDAYKYYVFTVDHKGSIYYPTRPGYLRYSVVDMRLDNGLGDVVQGEKSIVLDSQTTEKMIVAKGNGCFFWLLVHRYKSCEFRVYKIDSKGIDANPVSSFSTTMNNADLTSNPDLYAYMGGEMKVSPGSNMLAVVNQGPLGTGMVEMFRFDNTTGKVSDSWVLHWEVEGYMYGIGFSPDGTKLYIPVGTGYGEKEMPLWQYDMSLMPDIEKVKASGEIVGGGVFGGVRNGPDGKLYITGYNNKILNCIHSPGAEGRACNLQPLVFDVPDSVHFQIGFGNHVYTVNDLSHANSTVMHDSFICNDQSGLIELSAPGGFEKYAWSDGSTAQTNKVEPGKKYGCVVPMHAEKWLIPLTSIAAMDVFTCLLPFLQTATG